jgi:SAM-dependent methyltransferase
VRKSKRESFCALDLAEAFQLGHAISTLQDLKVLSSLAKGATVTELATKHWVDPHLLQGILEFVAARTNLVRKVGDRFTATSHCSARSRFLLELYAGAYRNNAFRLKRLMRMPRLASSLVDRVRYARAFETAQNLGSAWVADIIRQLRFNCILDIGCGPATLLLQLAAQNPGFTGWGLETNRSMHRLAQARIRQARAGDRLQVILGDCMRLSTALPYDVRSRIQAVSACQVANEMFGSGSSQLMVWLRKLRRVLPKRPMLLSDYYGCLGGKNAASHRETVLHDYAQLISGQGVPPATRAGWTELYARAGCRIVHIVEDTSTTRFLHILML